jgi:hypothetical protein
MFSGGAGGNVRGFSRARGGENNARAQLNLPNKWFPFGHMIIVSDTTGGKTTFLLWILLFPFTEQLLRMFYDEVIIISAGVAQGLSWDDSSGWSGFRDVYQIGNNNQSPDGFFKCFGSMSQGTWERKIKSRRIEGKRLVICDDVATDPVASGWLQWLNGSQRGGGVQLVRFGNLMLWVVVWQTCGLLLKGGQECLGLTRVKLLVSASSTSKMLLITMD